MQDGLRFRLLQPDEVVASWQNIRPLLEPAIEHCNGEFEADDLLDMVKNRRAFAFVLEDDGGLVLAGVAEVLIYPRKTVLYVLAVGGSKLNVLIREMWDALAKIGQLVGADSIRGAVRPSMERYYRRFAPGASIAYAIMERPL